MNTSILSLKKVENIERQIELFKNDISKITNEKNGSKKVHLKSRSYYHIYRDFFEFYIDDQPLIKLISKHYWKKEANENSGFFNTNISCLGGFGKFWDEINVSILTYKEFTKEQRQALFEMFKKNYLSMNTFSSSQELKEKISQDIRDDFLFYCCQGCGDSGCGGITLTIKKIKNNFIWTDNEKIEVQFESNQYEKVFREYLSQIRN